MFSVLFSDLDPGWLELLRGRVGLSSTSKTSVLSGHRSLHNRSATRQIARFAARPGWIEAGLPVTCLDSPLPFKSLVDARFVKSKYRKLSTR